MAILRHLSLSSPGLLVRIMAANTYSSLSALPNHVRQYVEEKASICKPDHIHVCDGSVKENKSLINILLKNKQIKALPKYDNCWLVRTDPADVARVESKTIISTPEKRDTIPITKSGTKGLLGNWMSPEELDNALNERFPGSMKGRTMYVIPFSMGPVGGPISKLGIELTDSPYVVMSMGIMTRMGADALAALQGEKNFVKCLHSVGCPLPTERQIVNNWPCNPEKTLITHIPANNEIASYGSGYGGNSLLGKKCFALRLGSILARREGWLAEHMLILGITNPKGEKRYLAAAFPSACGKTNLAMMQPTLPGYKVECVGDDIAWMKFDKEGRLRAINPEAGFFGVAPGTSMATNPNAMHTIMSNTVFTNVAETEEGGFFWEGLEDDVDPRSAGITTWLNKPYKVGGDEKAAHPNSRFCTPARQCPMMDPKWESPEGVPIDAFVFGGRRPEGVPLVYESFNWRHGVFIGASMRSESTAAAEHKKKVIMHDPFAMRPFFGYNFGHYLAHWLSFEKRPNTHLPRIFHVNWFRKDAKKGGFIWPGFGENARVLDWICRRVGGEDCAVESAIGYLPTKDSLNVEGLDAGVDMDQLFSIPKDFWMKEVEEVSNYFDEQINDDLPQEIAQELEALRKRVQAMN